MKWSDFENPVRRDVNLNGKPIQINGKQMEIPSFIRFRSVVIVAGRPGRG